MLPFVCVFFNVTVVSTVAGPSIPPVQMFNDIGAKDNRFGMLVSDPTTGRPCKYGAVLEVSIEAATCHACGVVACVCPLLIVLFGIIVFVVPYVLGLRRSEIPLHCCCRCQVLAVQCVDVLCFCCCGLYLSENNCLTAAVIRVLKVGLPIRNGHWGVTTWARMQCQQCVIDSGS